MTDGTAAMNSYQVCQFQVCSDVRLPCNDRYKAAGFSHRHTVTIRRSSLSEVPCLLRRLRPQRVYDVGHGLLVDYLHVSLYVEFSGTEVVVDVEDEFIPYAIPAILGPALSASTALTGGLPLFGASLSWEGKRFVLFAHSGTGKSTLIWALIQSGALFANDDLVPVLFDGQAHTACPSVSLYPKLRGPALEQAGFIPEHLQRATPGDDKFWVPLSGQQRESTPQPLSAFFLLQAEAGGCDVTVRQVPEEVAAQTIGEHLYDRWLFEKYVNPQRLSAQCGTLAHTVPMYTLTYQRCFDTLPCLAGAIHAALSNSAPPSAAL